MTGGPTGRYFHTSIYDPVRGRMIVYGGRDSTYSVLNDVWSLSLTRAPAWTQIDAPESPYRWGHSAVYDPARDRMLVMAGGEGILTYVADLWALSLAGDPAWQALSPDGAGPAARF